MSAQIPHRVPEGGVPIKELNEFGKHLRAARESHGLTQSQLGERTGIYQYKISHFEQGKKLPTASEWLKLAAVLKVSLQWFLSGANQAGDEVEDLAFQLRELGIVDLHVENSRVPGAFRPREQVVALALTSSTPPARIIEAMPAVLAWNQWNPSLLRTYGRAQGRGLEARIGWLADIALTIHRGQGFPGGCPAERVLTSFVEHVRPLEIVDNFQCSEATSLPPVSLRWKMHYPAPLSAFRERAERLNELRTG